MSIISSKIVTSRGAPADLSRVPVRWRSRIPEYCSVLAEANGLEFHQGLFRVFGVGEDCLGRDGVRWNASEWRAAYSLPESIVLWGENIFGDQFGVDTDSGALLMLSCEGGSRAAMPFKALTHYLEAVILSDPKNWIEIELTAEARARGIDPSLMEHLSFVVPLICGGKAEVENLEVMDAEAHLDVLGQFIDQMAGIPDGTRITGFRG